MKANDYLPSASLSVCGISAVAQTAKEFPFTYTYYGFGAPVADASSISLEAEERESTHDAA